MADKRNLGIALSGGGVRAAAFSLGGLLYLVDSGLNRRVGAISSVSGGSISNGVLLRSGVDFGQASVSEFDVVARQLIFLLTRKPIMGWFVIFLYLALVGLGLLIILLFYDWPIALPLWLKILALAMWGALFLFRGWPIEMWMHWKYFDQRTLEDTKGSPERTMAHVFCSTELGGFAPLYFLAEGNGFVYSPLYGGGRANHIRLATAVRASAALPGAFPPKLVLTRSIRFVRSRLSRNKPPWALFLADGGVWNNLGTQWFEGPGPNAFRQTSILSGGEVTRLIVMNASGPIKKLSKIKRLLFVVPLLAEVLNFGRVIDSLYFNTLEPRLGQASDLLEDVIHRGDAESSSDLQIAVASMSVPSTLQDMAKAKGLLLMSQLNRQVEIDKGKEIARRVTENPGLIADEGVLKEFAKLLEANDSLKEAKQRHQTLENLIKKIESAYITTEETLPLSITETARSDSLRKFCSKIGTKLTLLKEDEAMVLMIHGYFQAMEASTAFAFVDKGVDAESSITSPELSRFSALLPGRVLKN